MANVLIATLGASPIVVTAMVKALHAERGIAIDTLHVLYPGSADERRIGEGYTMIAEHLRTVCTVQPHALPFADPNSSATSIAFLQILVDLLDACEQAGDTVYLSLAGGRKNMSALLGVISQFYPCVAGLFHLLDRFDADPQRRHFFSIPQLAEMTAARRAEKLDPPLEHLCLVDLPYQPFAQADELRRYLAGGTDRETQPDAAAEPFRLEVSDEAAAFFGTVFRPNRSADLLEVWVSHTAYAHFKQIRMTCDEQRVRTFWKYLRQVADTDALRSHITVPAPTAPEQEQTFYLYSEAGKRERLLLTTRPGPVHQPGSQVDTVVVCGLALAQADGSCEPALDELMAHADTRPFRNVNALSSDEAVLLVPIGESPMIATQTCTLLEAEGFTVTQMALFYPQGFTPARNSVDLLEDHCRRRKLPCKRYPVRLKDLDSRAACDTYGAALLTTIYELRTRFPTQQLVLSLSGGRKGMSVLALVAAQYAEIERVYHTLISDPALEDQIEAETGMDSLRKLGPTQQAEHLWLDAYDRTKFTLFRIPVIPVKRCPR
jgi:hypothetical protein